MQSNEERAFKRTLKSSIHRLSTAEQKFKPIQSKTNRIKPELKTATTATTAAAEKDFDEEIITLTNSISTDGEEHQNDTRDSSPLTLTDDSGFGGNNSLSVSPIPPSMRRTPIPPDSPLLQKNNSASSPQLKKVKDFNRTMRRAKSFRALHHQRCNSDSDASSNNSDAMMISLEEVTFNISRTKFGRKGWKVYCCDEDDVDFRALVNSGVLDRVLSNIKHLELTGHAVPERMTVKVRG